jgi:hypothetical protein
MSPEHDAQRVGVEGVGCRFDRMAVVLGCASRGLTLDCGLDGCECIAMLGLRLKTCLLQPFGLSAIGTGLVRLPASWFLALRAFPQGLPSLFRRQRIRGTENLGDQLGIDAAIEQALPRPLVMGCVHLGRDVGFERSSLACEQER